jgi:general secretion pathway protein K
MNRHGSALLGALWLSVLLAGLTGAVLGAARLGAATTSNRVALTRAAWAAEACLAAVQERYAEEGKLDSVLTLELSAGVGCRGEVEDPGSRVNLNRAGSEMLGAVLGRPELAAAVLDWRDADDESRATGAERDWYEAVGASPPRNGPLAAVEELGFIRGFDDSVLARVEPLVTVEGDGHVNLNAAPAAVLGSLPGFSAEAVGVVLARRHSGSGWTSLEEVVYTLAPTARKALSSRYQELAALVQTGSARLVLHVEAMAGGAGLVYRMDVTVAPAGSRLAIVSRRVR